MSIDLRLGAPAAAELHLRRAVRNGRERGAGDTKPGSSTADALPLGTMKASCPLGPVHWLLRDDTDGSSFMWRAGLKQRCASEHGISNGNSRPFQPWQVGFGQARSSGPDSYVPAGVRMIRSAVLQGFEADCPVPDYCNSQAAVPPRHPPSRAAQMVIVTQTAENRVSAFSAPSAVERSCDRDLLMPGVKAHPACSAASGSARIARIVFRASSFHQRRSSIPATPKAAPSWQQAGQPLTWAFYGPSASPLSQYRLTSHGSLKAGGMAWGEAIYWAGSICFVSRYKIWPGSLCRDL